MSGDQFPKREGRGVTLQGDDQGIVQRDIDKLYRHIQRNGKAATLTSLTIGAITITGIVTSVGDPGYDYNLPTEQAVREAINTAHGWSEVWAMFLGAA